MSLEIIKKFSQIIDEQKQESLFPNHGAIDHLLEKTAVQI